MRAALRITLPALWLTLCLPACNRVSRESTESTSNGRGTAAVTEGNNQASGTAPSAPVQAQQGQIQQSKLTMKVRILSKPVELDLPYTKPSASFDYVRGKEPFDTALYRKAPDILSSDTPVVERLQRIDTLHRDTHQAFVQGGGSGRDPIVAHFNAALEDLVLAYFNKTKDAIVASSLSVEQKKAALGEMKINDLDVLAWAPSTRGSISFYAVEGEMGISSP